MTKTLLKLPVSDCSTCNTRGLQQHGVYAEDKFKAYAGLLEKINNNF